MVELTARGELNNTYKFLKKISNKLFYHNLDKYGQQGVEALASMTPKRTGKTANSWFYEIIEEENGFAIRWNNSNVNNGVNIALILQYGHGTGWGGYVDGIDYINPALRPVFDSLLDNVWKEVTE